MPEFKVTFEDITETKVILAPNKKEVKRYIHKSYPKLKIKIIKQR